MSDDASGVKPLGIQGDTPTIAFHVRCGDHDREAKLSGVPVEAHDTCPWCVAVALAKRIAALEAKLATAVGGSAWFETIRAEVEPELRERIAALEAERDWLQDALQCVARAAGVDVPKRTT